MVFIIIGGKKIKKDEFTKKYNSILLEFIYCIFYMMQEYLKLCNQNGICCVNR